MYNRMMQLEDDGAAYATSNGRQEAIDENDCGYLEYNGALLLAFRPMNGLSLFECDYSFHEMIVEE